MVSLKYPTDFLHKIIHILVKIAFIFIKQNRIVSYQDKLARLYSYEESDYCSILTIRLGCKNYYRKNMFTELEKHSFENDMFFIPKAFDQFLKSNYGDYMTPPPVDKRGGHFLSAYKKD